ncbi:MAG: FimV/HubP family polar landmark protein, partial [Methylophilaceae bacterium]|nr:FimV/HubP family polar landmark protein [Methylophilaceae bacterium]
MHKSKLKRIALAVCFAFLPFSAHSAGLGKLTVISGLGEPLRAEIDLVSTTPEELSSLTAAIAPQEAYAVQGIERRSVHSAIQVDVVKKPDGTGILKLSTRQPVDDPFLDMLIQVDWATGRLLREYTVLLDPPGYQDTQPPVAVTKTTPAVASAPITSTPLAEPPSASPVSAYVETEPTSEYMTKTGDNLSKIAKEMQLEGYSLDQMLVALYRSNPQAFDGDNMNRLKVGQIIKAPTYDDLSAFTPQEATKEIRVQTSDWNAYRNKLAGVVAESAPMAEDGG